jgi:cyclopropane fatty-acyl-phospholipid synthase-like methyltransferase
MKHEFSLERIVPDQMDNLDAFDQASLKLHRERYAFAIQHGMPGYVLDIACGTGYGSYQILEHEKFSNSRVKAVDISEEAIGYGRKRYAHPFLEFICSDVMDFSDRDLFDTIVSLETIEHVKDPQNFIKKMHGLLKKDGVLIISAPVTPSTDGNPFHLTDFTPSGFRKLFDQGCFTMEDRLIQEQSYTLGSLIHAENKRLDGMRPDLGKYYMQHPNIFFRRIWSLMTDGFKNKYLTLVLKKIQ